jgi:hypothetical protein
VGTSDAGSAGSAATDGGAGSAATDGGAGDDAGGAGSDGSVTSANGCQGRGYLLCEDFETTGTGDIPMFALIV